MKGYETICILHPDLVEDAVKSALERFGGIITGSGGEVKKSESWGQRKLAYKVHGQARGTFLYFLYEGPPAAINELERNLRITEEVIRFMTIKVDSTEEAAKVKAQLLDDPTLSFSQEGGHGQF